MIWRIILFWLLGANLALADLPRYSFVASVSFCSNCTALLNYWGHPLDGYLYTNDSWGLRTNITRQLGLTTNIVTVGYDGIGELAFWTATEPGGAARQNEQLGYGYDAAGNLANRTNGAMVQTFTVNSLNEIGNVTRTGTFTVTGATPAPVTSVTVNGAPAQTNGDFTFASTGNSLLDGNNTFTIIAHYLSGTSATTALTVNLPTTVNFQYDSNGNLTSDGTRSFSYDAENQLTSVWVSGAWQAAFFYDGLNRRRMERDYTWTNSAWLQTNETRFIYDGMQVIQERDSNNNPQVTYTRGLDLSMSLSGAGGIGGMLARTDATGSTYYHSDGAGNITAMMDGNQDIVARAEYDPFGKFIKLSGSLANANRYRFSSKEYVPQAGLYYFGSRFYEPNFERWLNRDPIGEAGGVNVYGFAGNSPANVLDAYGLSLASYLNWVGKGIYDYAMGDRNRGGIANSYGAMRAEELGGIDPHDNVLRDAFGLTTAMVGQQLVAAALGEVVIGPAMGAAVEGTCSALGQAFPGVFEAEAAAAGDLAGAGAADASSGEVGGGTAMRNVVQFQGMEVRAVRDLSHLDQGTLEAMQEVGFAPRTVNGEQMVLHHLDQNPAGPLVEMPRGNHSVWNTVQHPLGNTAGAGLTDVQRSAFDAWRTEYWQWRATRELNLRRVLGN